MNDKLKLFAAAASEMVRTRKVRLLASALAVGIPMTILYSMSARPIVGAACGVAWAAGATLAQGLRQTHLIYNRMERARYSARPKNEVAAQHQL